MNVSISNYSGRNTESYKVTINDLSLWFSYRTVVAFRFGGQFYIRENDWSTTTGRHLNEIDSDHSIRIPGVEFERELDRITIGQIQLD